MRRVVKAYSLTEMLTNTRNSNMQGNIGLGAAIGYFTSCEYIVSVPLTDTQDYDLIIESDGVLQTVQVKTTRYQLKSGNYAVCLKTISSNAGRVTQRKPFGKVDILFVLTNSGDMYSIPGNLVEGMVEISLGDKYIQYKL
jgi:hypothetical protein